MEENPANPSQGKQTIFLFLLIVGAVLVVAIAVLVLIFSQNKETNSSQEATSSALKTSY